LWLGRGGRYKDSQSARIDVSRALALYNYVNSRMPETHHYHTFSITSITSTNSSSTGDGGGIDSIVVTRLKPRPPKNGCETTSKHDKESSQSSTHYSSDHLANTERSDRAASVDSMAWSIGTTSSSPASLKSGAASPLTRRASPVLEERRKGMELERPVHLSAEEFPTPNKESILGNATYWVALMSMLGGGGRR
jgi:hypothetical protein